MVKDEEILFITTSLYTQWLQYSHNCIKKNFPNSEHLVIDGTKNWPYIWFAWIEAVKKFENIKYFIHIDEDCFLMDRESIVHIINNMETNGIDIVGPSDGFSHYRSANGVAMNSFLLIGKVDILKHINLNGIQFKYDRDIGWMNSFGLSFKEEYLKDFNYTHPVVSGGCNFKFEQEPYYAFFWQLKENGCKFEYLYNHFDENFKSSNLRMDINSPDICIHMWYTRQWSDSFDVWGLPNNVRYERVKNYLDTL